MKFDWIAFTLVVIAMLSIAAFQIAEEIDLASIRQSVANYQK